MSGRGQMAQESPRQTKPKKKGQFMNFSQGHSGTKVQCGSCLFSQGKTPEFTKMGKIHELFVLPLSLVWFAGATPEWRKTVACVFLGSVFGRTDFSRISIFGPPDFFADFVAGFLLLIFVGKSAQKNPPGKSPAKSP